jgi:hypothetical protein
MAFNGFRIVSGLWLGLRAEAVPVGLMNPKQPCWYDRPQQSRYPWLLSNSCYLTNKSVYASSEDISGNRKEH